MQQEMFQNNRTDYLYRGKEVTVVESHNFVLPVWAEYCSNTKTEYRLITFDYHMDTRPSFSRYIYHTYGETSSGVKERQDNIFEEYIDYKYDADKIEEMTQRYVFYDEHIMVAYNMGYILDFFCVCKDNQDDTKGDRHYLALDSDVSENDIKLFCDEAKEEAYILDIDLDFFNCEADFQRHRSVIADLIANTEIITIAREQKCFNYLKSSDQWTNERALNKLLDLIAEKAGE